MSRDRYSIDGSGSGYVVVASSDASAEIKAGADFVCSGVNDEIVINQAILALTVAGLHVAGMPVGKLLLSAGQFKIKNPILTHGGVTIQGSNAVSTVIFAEIDGTTTDDTYAAIVGNPDPPVADGKTKAYGFMEVRDLAMWGAYNGFDGGTRTDSTGIDFTVDSLGASISTSNVLIHNCRIKGFNTRSIKLNNNNGTNQVHKCHLESRSGIDNTNIAIHGGDVIKDCTFTHDGAVSLGFESGVQPKNGTKIINNYFNNMGQAAIVGSVTDVLIDGNTFSGSQILSASGNSPIYIFTNPSRIKIVNNVFLLSDSDEFYGLFISGGTHCTVANNVVVQSTGSTGIRVSGSFNNIHNNTVVGATTHGVRLDTSSNCNVQGNLCDIDGGTTTNGVSSTGGDDNTVLGNSSNGATNPISLSGSSNTTANNT